MGEGDQRRSRRTARFDSRELARLSGKVNTAASAWDERTPAPPGAVAHGSDQLPISRTATLDDPLTTSLLAEVARRTRTVEVSPDQIDEATELEPTDRDRRDPRDPQDPDDAAPDDEATGGEPDGTPTRGTPA
jgi:hypothetical protein